MPLAPDDLERLTRPRVEITVTSCAYTCCGRGWRRRDGYEQRYRGKPALVSPEGFMLYGEGIGGPGYVVAVLAEELVSVEVAE